MSNLANKLKSTIAEKEEILKRQKEIQHAKKTYENAKTALHISYISQVMILQLSYMISVGETPIISTRDMRQDLDKVFYFSDNVNEFKMFVNNELHEFTKWLKDNDLTYEAHGESDGIGVSSWIVMKIIPAF